MTGETLQRVGDVYVCAYCSGESRTRLPSHEPDCPVVRDDVPDYFEDLEPGTTVRYIGPEEVPEGYVTPSERKQPYTFRYVSLHGTVAWETAYGGPKYHAPDHPCRDPRYWVVIDE